MRTKTILLIVGIAAAILLLPRILRRQSLPADSPANPPPQAPPVNTGDKKTVFGKIVNGATQIGSSVGGKYGDAVAGVGNILGAFTK